MKLLEAKVWPLHPANSYYAWSVDFDVTSRGASGKEATLEAAMARVEAVIKTETREAA